MLRTLLLYCLLLCCCFLPAQELPPVVSFDPELYHGGCHYWALDQGMYVFIYVANNYVLLVFSGHLCSIYPSPHATLLRLFLIHFFI